MGKRRGLVEPPSQPSKIGLHSDNPIEIRHSKIDTASVEGDNLKIENSTIQGTETRILAPLGGRITSVTITEGYIASYPDIRSNKDIQTIRHNGILYTRYRAVKGLSKSGIKRPWIYTRRTFNPTSESWEFSKIGHLSPTIFESEKHCPYKLNEQEQAELDQLTWP